MTATTTAPAKSVQSVHTSRIRRCRMHNRLDNPCPNPALTDDDGDIAICVRHASEVLQLVNDRARARKDH